MTLSQYDREQVERLLDELEDEDARRIIYSRSAFEEWFFVTLPAIYQKIRAQISRLWDWLRSKFS